MLALLKLSKMCRVCRDDSDCLLELFDDSFLPNKEQEPTLAEMLSKCSGCRVDRDDGFPQFVCSECVMATRGAFRLRQQYRKSMQFFSHLLGMVTEHDDKEQRDSEDLEDLEPSQETCNAIGITEAEGEASQGDESSLEPLYVELVASECLELESPTKGNTQLHDINDNRSSESISVDSSSDEKNASPMKKLRSNSRSSSDDSWSPSSSKKATKKLLTLTDRSYSKSFSDGSSKKRKKNIKKYPCTQCSRSFDQKGNLQSHIRVHTGERPFKCTYCSQTFRQRGHLGVHIRGHTGEKPFKCTYCSQTFKQRGHLSVHIRRGHTIEKRFKCSYCSYSCNHFAGLKRHIKDLHRGH